MAGDWHKMRNDLRDDGRVRLIARRLNQPRVVALGCLHIAWAILNQFGKMHRDGTDAIVEGWSLLDLDDECGVQGFGAAMSEAGWLREDDDGLVFPDYEKHNSTTAKQRAVDASRKQTGRSSDKCPPKVGQKSDRTRTREEKRREEKKEDACASSSSPRACVREAEPARGVPASIRAAEPLEPMAEDVIAACQRVTGRTPLKGHEVGACANWAAGMRFAYPDSKPVTIHSMPSTLEAVIRAACEHATPQTVSSRGTTGILRWLETTVQSCIDGGIWPGERIATRAPPAKLVSDPKQLESDRAVIEQVYRDMETAR